VVDHLSKQIRLALANGEVTSEVAQIYQDTVWRDFGLPEVVISDHSSQFVSKFTRDLYQLLGIKTTHPQPTTHKQMVRQNISTKK